MCYKPMRGKRLYDKVLKKRYVKVFPNTNSKRVGDISLPCGKCIGCRLDKANAVSARCYLEAKQWDYNYFVTLTYDPEHIPRNGSLNSKHLTAFMKKLRTYYSRHFNHQNIRFYACGEYGEKTTRPHYHLIIFNLPIFDLKFYKMNYDTDKLYNSDYLSNIWGKGHVVIGAVTPESIGYVARYTLKKQVNKDVYEGLVPEFVRMSRNPGIGRKYYDDNKDEIYKNDYFTITTKKGVKKVKPDKYFDSLYEKENPERLELLKKKREAYADAYDQMIIDNYGIDPAQFKEEEFRKKAKQALLLKNRKGV